MVDTMPVVSPEIIPEVKRKEQWRLDIVALRDKYYGKPVVTVLNDGTKVESKNVPVKVNSDSLRKALKEFKGKFLYDLPKGLLYEMLVAFQTGNQARVVEIENIGRAKVAQYNKKVVDNV